MKAAAFADLPVHAGCCRVIALHAVDPEVVFSCRRAFGINKTERVKKTAILMPELNKRNFFQSFSTSLASVGSWTATTLENVFKQLAEQAGIKPGELQLPLRIMLVGDKFGPGVFNIAEVLGKEETKNRIDAALNTFNF